MANYPYKPLNCDREEIRILRFKPQDVATEKLECRLVHISLRDEHTPAYFAISYVWGDAGSRRNVEIDGVEVSVPVNTDIALRNLHDVRTKRYHPSEVDRPALLRSTTGECDVWIDAICINQDDMIEREIQVNLMGSVYGKASAVLIWLGEGSQGLADAAFDNIFRLHATGAPLKAQSNIVRDGVGRPMPLRRLYSLPHTVDWPIFESFFSSPWFERVWTIQEAVLNEKTYTVFGNHVCEHNWIELAARYLAMAYPLERQSGDPSVGLDRVAMRASMKYAATGLTEMLVPLNANCFSASDDRDMIYSLVGLVSPRARPIIDPSYSRSLAEVYARATVAALSTDGRLAPLTYATILTLRPKSSSKEDTDLPSWAIKCHWKWTYDGSPSPIRSHRSISDCVANFENLPNEVARSGWRTLPLRGIIVDRVVEVSPVMPPATFQDTKRLLACLKDIRARNMSRFHGVDTLHLDTITFYAMWERLRCEVEARLDLTLLHQRCIWMISLTNALFDRDHDKLSMMLKQSPGKLLDVLESLGTLLETGACNRSFFWARNGLVGVTMPATQPEDLVCDFVGGEVPLVLRKEDDSFRLIGACRAYWMRDCGRDIMTEVVRENTLGLRTFSLV